MSTETETRLRAAFRAAEQVITVDDTAPGAELLRRPDTSPRHRATVWALVAAAVVIVAVAALAIGLRTRGATPPVAPATSPVPTTSTAPVVLSNPQPESCDVTLPAAWRAAILVGHVPGHLDLKTVDANGNAYAVQTLGTTSQLVQILPDRSVRPVYRAPAGSRIDDAQVDGGWAVVGLTVGPSGSSGLPPRGRPAGIVAIRIGARTGLTIRHGSATNATLDQVPVIAHGVVYWADGNSAGVAFVHSYSLATHTQRVLAKGLVGWPFVTGGGVYWFEGVYGHETLHTERAGTFPAGYSVAAGAKINGGVLESNGNSAWQVSVHAGSELRVAQGGRHYVTVVRSTNADQNLTADALSGTYLFYGDGLHQRVLDWATGAATTLPSASVYGDAVGGGGVVALQTGDGLMSMVPSADLPALHC